MKNYKVTDWLPTTKKEMEMRGWDELDVILFSGDAYVDHPSFGAAVAGRIIEAEGLRVAIIPQPNWRDDLRDFKKLGNLDSFLVSAQAAWTPWSINIQPTNAYAARMHTRLMHALICVPNTPLSFTAKS